MMKQANFTKKQYDVVLSAWKKLTAYLNETKSKTVEEVAERLPEGYVFEEFIRDSVPKVYPAVVVTKLPWQSLLSFNSFAGYVTNHSEVQYFNMKTKEWEESLYYYY